MGISIDSCDLNSDFFHFTNIANIDSILNKGLIPSIGVASRMVGDEENVSLSQGGKGIIGIIASFIDKFANITVSEIPAEYKKYFDGLLSLSPQDLIGKDIACRAIMRKLQDEVFFRVKLSEEELSRAQVGGLTEFDIKLPMGIDKSHVDIITDSNNKVLRAFGIARIIYEKAKDIEIIREIHGDFFYMFENIEIKDNPEEEYLK